MASFNLELPNDLINDLSELGIVSSKMMGEMTKAGADVVKNVVEKNMKKSFKSTAGLEECLFVSRTYKTKSDDGINNKVLFYGYFVNKKGKKVPSPLVALAREYGTSKGEKSKPYFRKSFNKRQIENAMLEVQEKYLPKE